MKKTVFWNLRQNKQLFNDIWGDEKTNQVGNLISDQNFTTSTKKKRKKIRIKTNLRSSSNDKITQKVDTYVLSLKNSRFTPLKINNSQWKTRQYNYWEVANRNYNVANSTKSIPQHRSKSQISCERMSSMNRKLEKPSFIDKTELSTCDLASTKVSMTASMTEFTTPHKVKSWPKENLFNTNFVTPIKQNNFISSGMNTNGISTPMLIRSLNVSMVSPYWTESKPAQKQMPSNYQSHNFIKTCIKKKIKCSSKLRRGKTYNETAQSSVITEKIKEKRLNVKNQELHWEADIHSDSKYRTLKPYESDLNSIASPNEKHIVTSKTKAIDKKLAIVHLGT